MQGLPGRRLGAQAATVGLILEGFVAFERELSVVAVRGRDGEFRAWPLTENWHVDGVLSASLAPAKVEPALADIAFAHARKLADALDYVGVFALELFCRDGELLANELAPRVHNSGHWTIEGSETSQFENHLRAVLGLPLGDTRMVGHACMLNWIGELPGCRGGAARTRRALARLRQGAAGRPQGRACDGAGGFGAKASSTCWDVSEPCWVAIPRSRRWLPRCGADSSRRAQRRSARDRAFRRDDGSQNKRPVSPAVCMARRIPYFMFEATKSQFTRFQNASTYFGRALR